MAVATRGVGGSAGEGRGMSVATGCWANIDFGLRAPFLCPRDPGRRKGPKKGDPPWGQGPSM